MSLKVCQQFNWWIEDFENLDIEKAEAIIDEMKAMEKGAAQKSQLSKDEAIHQEKVKSLLGK